MSEHVQDVIAAFADGEPVAAEDLRGALSTDEGREYLIDLVALRGLVRPEGAHELPAVAAIITSDRNGGATSAQRQRPGYFWSAAAAALIAVSTLGGFAAGRLTGVASDVPPPAVTVLATPPPAFLIPAPEPTTVIRLEHGRDWTEHAGGN